jgi:mannose-6-phosphate isomerase class I
MRSSNYDIRPAISIGNADLDCFEGWREICEKISGEISNAAKEKTIVVVETYPGVHDAELTAAFRSLQPRLFLAAKDALLNEGGIEALTWPDVTDDRIFGFMTRLTMDRFFDAQKSEKLRQEIQASTGLVIIYGTGASLLADQWDLLIYADLARWEIQQRMRRQEIGNLGLSNLKEEISRKYKQAYFVDWRVADRLKRCLMDRWHFVLDTNRPGHPVMVSGPSLRTALHKTAQRPFRVVPFFDPGPWGGQWMKETFDLDRSAPNYAWCFDCVPEENSLLFSFGKAELEVPAQNLVYQEPRRLLGESVYARFGAEFPIRFDFLDTMGGGNLSLQVHPLTEYIREHFGMLYTQDESYYLMDAEEDGMVYLGLKNEVQPGEMIAALQLAQQQGLSFNADDYAARWPARKHDHFLIPAGTLHCSGKNTMVLEISATPYIFTFKLWDWGRLGLDGQPRPINIEHGKNNIAWERNEDWVRMELINRFEIVATGENWFEERTGLHETEFIETRRHWFSGRVRHHTHGGVNVLNLVEGQEAIVESPEEAFEPFVVHYAETFIVPAAVGPYTIRPFGASEGKTCATLKAFVRT